MDMRKGILFAVLIGMLALPVLAQFPGGGLRGGALDGNTLLSLPDVQKELNLTDDQKEMVKKASDARREAMRSAFSGGNFDREAMTKATEEFNTAMGKVRKELKPEQQKRLLGIEVQAAEKAKSPRLFASADVQKAIKMTDEQKATVKELMSDMEKDLKELRDDAKGDREKMQAMVKKMTSMNQEAYAKITKKLTEEQKTALKELRGEEFKGNLNPFGGFNKGKGNRKKDDI